MKVKQLESENKTSKDIITMKDKEVEDNKKEISRLKGLLKNQEKSASESEAAKDAAIKAMQRKLELMNEELKEKDRL